MEVMDYHNKTDDKVEVDDVDGFDFWSRFPTRLETSNEESVE